MKRMKWMGFATMAILMSMGFIACSQENDAVLPNEQPTEEYVTVNLGVTGEYLELSESPLGTRAEGELKDLIGVQVYTLGEYEYGNQRRYAYGVFNSLDNVSIKLLKGEEYGFLTSIIVDGYGCNEHLGHDNCIGFGYEYPIGTDFNYSSDLSSSDFPFSNFRSISGYDNGYIYHHDRFFGARTYTPTENGVVELSTRRTAYGAHYVAEGLTEGKLTVDVSDGVGTLYSVEISPENPESDGIYTFSDIGNAIIDGYTSTKQLSVKWTKDDGSETLLGTYDVTFKRNVKTTIQINVSLQNGIVITREEAAMTDDENKYVIEGGEITEVPVTTVP